MLKFNIYRSLKFLNKSLFNSSVPIAQFGSSQTLSFNDNFEFSFDNFFKKDHTTKKPEHSSKQDMDDFSKFLDISNYKSNDFVKLRNQLHTFSVAYDHIENVSDKQLRQIALNLQKLCVNSLLQERVYDHATFKSLFLLLNDRLLSLKAFLQAIQQVVQTPELVNKLTFEGVTNILLLLSDVLKDPAFQKALETSQNQTLLEILRVLENQTEILLQSTHPHEHDFSYFLPKILFCFLHFETKSKAFLNKLLSNILYCDLSKFEEMELTSLLYVVIKMEKKLHILTEETKSSLHSGFEELYSQLIRIITERITTQNLSYNRVPYILYCFSMIGSCPRVAVDGLVQLFLKNIESYNINEVCTVMYCVWRLPDLDPQNKVILKIINLYFETSQQKIQLLTDTNLYSAFLGIRKGLKGDMDLKQREKVENFLAGLLTVFKSKLAELSIESRIRVLYEVTHIHKMIERKEFLERFTPFLFELDLNSLNNHDVITVGFLMKKYLAINENHFRFWKRYLECLSSRKWSSKLEDNRIILIFTNLRDLVNKNQQSGIKAKELKSQWIETIDANYQIFMKKKEDFRLNNKKVESF